MGTSGGHVFINYAHGTDSAYLERLVAHLTSAGRLVWHARELLSGDRWDHVVREKIDTCAAFVVVMTPASDNSSWVNREIAQAEDENRPILPLLLAGKRFFRLNTI